ncbi:MAG: phospholipase D family protein [Bacteroidota bacterium]
MAKFLTGNELNSELEKIFERADEQIILISPYIKLHERFISTLRTKKDNHKIEITIVFGKNEEDLSKSMKQEDFNFFKEFPNIQIRYERRLHAKYYANESSAILTSMNLYDYSQDTNIEAGVMTKATLLGNLASNFMTNVTGEDSFDNQAWTYFKRVIEQSDLLFNKTPQFESAMLGLTKKYKESKVETDKLTEFFADKSKFESKYRKDNYEKKNVGFQQNLKEANPEQNTEIISNKISSETKFLSTTALSKEVGISSKELFVKFEKLNWIERINEDWVLTDSGKSKGAQIKKGQYGEFIAWPDTIINEIK